jgi:hypothetical protein
MPKLMLLIATVIALIFSCLGDRILSKDGATTANGLILRAYLVDLFEEETKCPLIRTIDEVEFWLSRRKRETYSDADAFVGMHLADGDLRLYYRIVSPGIFWDDYGVPYRVGPAPSATPAVRLWIHGRYTQLLLNPRFGLGRLDKSNMVGHREDGSITIGLILAHEQGHACGGRKPEAFLSPAESNACAVQAENAFRLRRGLLPLRESH